MRTIRGVKCPPPLAMALLVAAAWPLSAAAATIPASGLAVAKSGNDLVLSFPTTSPNLYLVQRCPDLRQEWTDAQSRIPGDGTVKAVVITNAISGNNEFYRLRIQTPTRLLLPQSMAFTILGHWCGGIREEAYVTDLDPISGFLTGDVHLSTTCSTGGRGSPPATFQAWAAVTWDFAGNVISSSTLSNGAAVNPTFIATDVYGDTVYNAGAAAYLAVPTPTAPTGVTATQSGDQFQVSWTPNGINPVAVTSSTLTATPVDSTASILTATLAGPATTGMVALLQPQTTYRITVVNTTIGGSGPASIPIRVTTSPATVAPSAPSGVIASWANLNPTGATDTLVATWQAADPGNSPIDQYQVTISGSDGAGTSTQTVSGTTLTALFSVDYIPNWSVTVTAHNAAGWGPSSNVITLGGL